MSDIPNDAVEAARQAFRKHADWRYRAHTARGICICGETLPVPSPHQEFGRHQMTKILEAAAPIIRADERRRVIAEIQASNLGAPLYLEDDGTARIASGPEMREILCAFIAERSGE